MLYTKESFHQREVLVSEVLESHGIPDPYYWKINRNGKFIPQNDKTETPIENIIIINNAIGKIEYDAFQKIQEKVRFMAEGDYFLWISPTHPIYYPTTSKIIITQKIGDLFLNRSVNTDWDALGSILAAKELSTLSNLDPNIFKNTNDVRANPIFIDKSKEEYLGLALKKMLDQKSIEMMASGEDFRAKKKYIDDSLEGKEVQMGKKSRSCEVSMAKSAFQVFAGEDEYGSLQFDCPSCHKTNTREPGKLKTNCEHCGADVQCGKKASELQN